MNQGISKCICRVMFKENVNVKLRNNKKQKYNEEKKLVKNRNKDDNITKRKKIVTYIKKSQVNGLISKMLSRFSLF